MIHKIELFLFILSCVYSLKFVIEFIARFTEKDPQPMVIDKTNQVFLYMAISYIITFILT